MKSALIVKHEVVTGLSATALMISKGMASCSPQMIVSSSKRFEALVDSDLCKATGLRWKAVGLGPGLLLFLLFLTLQKYPISKGG